MRAVVVLAALLLAACSDGGTAALYAREARLPAHCFVTVSPAEAQALVSDALPTVPVKVNVAQRSSHLARRDRVTGVWTITLGVDELTSRAVAHEAAHVVTMDDGRGPLDEPQPQPDIHGDVFVTAYKIMLARMVSQECASAL